MKGSEGRQLTWERQHTVDGFDRGFHHKIVCTRANCALLKTTIYDTGKWSKSRFDSPTSTHVSGYIYLLPKTSSGTDCGSGGWPSSLVHINYTAPAVNCVALINGLLIAAACFFFCCKVLKVKAWLVSRGRKQSHDQKSLLGWQFLPSGQNSEALGTRNEKISRTNKKLFFPHAHHKSLHQGDH